MSGQGCNAMNSDDINYDINNNHDYDDGVINISEFCKPNNNQNHHCPPHHHSVKHLSSIYSQFELLLF